MPLRMFIPCLVALSLTGCVKENLARTVVDNPAHADPGKTGFGTGLSVSSGDKGLLAAAESVVVAASSDEKGPSAKNEGDTLWRVRGSVLEHCEWAADGRDDCRIATYQGFAAPPLVTLLPTIIESRNLARGAELMIFGDHPALIGSVASKPTAPTRTPTDHAIWVTAAVPALLGAQPVFLCAPLDEGPTCKALPFMAVSIVGTMVERRGSDFVSVLWVHAGSNVVAGLGVVAADLGIQRCESVHGEPRCVRAKEMSQ